MSPLHSRESSASLFSDFGNGLALPLLPQLNGRRNSSLTLADAFSFVKNQPRRRPDLNRILLPFF